MSGFIYRDYTTPRIAFHNNKAAIRNLWGKLLPVETVDGIQVLKKKLYFYGRDPSEYTEKEKGIRSDRVFKRFLSKIGITHKDLRKGSKKDIKNMYFWLNYKKLKYDTKTATYIKDKFNTDYAQFAQYHTTISPDTVIIYPQNTSAGTELYTPPADPLVAKYEFYYNGVASSVSHDGYFGIHPYGMIYMTFDGAVSPANKVKYDPLTPNSVSYTIKTTYVDIDTPPSYQTKTLTVNRDYIDVKIVVGGQYTKGLKVNEVELTLEAINLPQIRSIIEANPTKYIGNISNDTSDLYSMVDAKLTGLGLLHNAVAGAEHDSVNGHFLDILALHDHVGEYYEVLEPCFNEQVYLKEVGDASSDIRGMTLNSGKYVVNKVNVEYTYYKRYRLKSIIDDSSVFVDNLIAASEAYEKAIRKILTPANLTAKTLYKESENVTYESLLQEAIAYLNTLDDDTAIFYKGQLRLDAFEAMTPNEFAELMAECFKVGYSKDDGSFIDKVVAVVIVIVAVIVAVVVFVFTGNIKWALMAAQVVLMAGYMIAANNGMGSGGLKIIGTAMQINGAVLSVVALVDVINSIYDQSAAIVESSTIMADAATSGATEAQVAAMQSGINDLMVGVATDVVKAGGMVYGLATQVGVVDGGSEIGNYIGLAGGAFSSFQSLPGLLSSLQSEVGEYTMSNLYEYAAKNISNSIQVAKNVLNMYANINALNTDTPQYGENDHSVKEEGATTVYMLHEMNLENDALQMLQDKVLTPQFGGYKTDIALNKLY